MYVSPFEYLYFWMRYPKYKAYLDMGYGIEARYNSSQKYWRSHLKCTKEFINCAIGEDIQGSVAILGSGRLLDIDIEYLLSKFKSIHLYDADPRAIHLTKRRFKDIKHIQSILTEVKDADDLLNKSYDTVISLNMLSQIPIYQRSVSQMNHIKLLKSVAKKKIIIVTDQYWHFYNIHKADWDTQNALEIEWGSLLGVGKLVYKDAWFWHIIPPGLEDKDLGSIHEVYGLSFDK